MYAYFPSSKLQAKLRYEGRSYSRCGPVVKESPANHYKYYLKCDHCGTGRAICILRGFPDPDMLPVWVEGSFMPKQDHRADCQPDFNENSSRNIKWQLEATKYRTIQLATQINGIKATKEIYNDTVHQLQNEVGEEKTALFVSRQNFLQAVRRAKRSRQGPPEGT